MNVLVVSALLPYPLYSGGQVRLYNLLKKLSRQHRITLLSFTRKDEEKEFIQKLSFCHEIYTIHRGRAFSMPYVLSSLVSSLPLLLSSYNNKKMTQKIEEILRESEIDLIHAEPFYVWPALPRLRTVPIVSVEHNIEYTVYEQYVRSVSFQPLRPFLSYDVHKLRRWEQKIWHASNHVITVSRSDKEVVSRYIPSEKITIVPNGVDIEFFTFRPKKIQKIAEPVFLFVGNFSWMQNKDALKFLLSAYWPALKKMYPHASLRVIGANLPGVLERSARKAGATTLHQVEDIRNELAEADILLAPIRVGGGTKYKILEAMASGVPVITTHKGAEGLDVENGTSMYISDSVETNIKDMKYVLEHPKESYALKLAARKIIEDKYSWDTIAVEQDRVWSQIYEKKD